MLEDPAARKLFQLFYLKFPRQVFPNPRKRVPYLLTVGSGAEQGRSPIDHIFLTPTERLVW